MVVLTGLGELLREAREAKGYSLDDLQSITKIQKRYLSGIEKEDYSSMPGAFYARAFIKQYAEAVDLDPQEILSLYKEEHPSPEAEAEEEVTPLRSRHRRVRSNNAMKQMMPKLFFAIIIIAIVVIIALLMKWTMNGKGENSPVDDLPEDNKVTVQQKEPPKPPVVEEEPKEEPEEEPEEPVMEQKVEVVSVAGDTTTYRLSEAEQFKLRIELSGESWVSVLTDNQEELTPGGAAVLKDGDVVDLDVTDQSQIRIRLGRTNDAKVFINDKELPYELERVDQTIYIQFEK